jgi:hypothetical protein
MEAGLSLSTEEVAEEVMDTTLTKREAVSADIMAAEAAAAVMEAEVATEVMEATTITEVEDTEVADIEVVTISSNLDNTTTTIIIIIIEKRMEIKRKMPMLVEVIPINPNLNMEIIKPNGLLMDRKRNQRSHPQRRKKQAPKMKLKMPPKYIKV